MSQPLTPGMAYPLPAPPVAQYGLFAGAIGPQALPTHGIAGGLEWMDAICGDGHAYPAICPAAPPTKVFDEGLDPKLHAIPFLTYASIKCGALGHDWAEWRTLVLRKHQVLQQSMVERALWGASTDDSPGYFQGAGIFTPTPVTVIPDATNVVAAISALEQALADCNTGKVGYIHVRPRAVAYLAYAHQLRWDGTVYRTMRGNVVICGDGYSGLGPADEAPTATTEWFYATGRVFLFNGETEVYDPKQTFNRTTNQQFLLAEQPWAIGVECCIQAIETTLAVP